MTKFFATVRYPRTRILAILVGLILLATVFSIHGGWLNLSGVWVTIVIGSLMACFFCFGCCLKDEDSNETEPYHPTT